MLTTFIPPTDCTYYENALLYNRKHDKYHKQTHEQSYYLSKSLICNSQTVLFKVIMQIFIYLTLSIPWSMLSFNHGSFAKCFFKTFRTIIRKHFSGTPMMSIADSTLQLRWTESPKGKILMNLFWHHVWCQSKLINTPPIVAPTAHRYCYCFNNRSISRLCWDHRLKLIN